MANTMTKAERGARYRELLALIPGVSTGEKFDWIAEKLGVSRITVKSWNAEATYPIPESRLRELERMVAERLAEAVDKLKQ